MPSEDSSPPGVAQLRVVIESESLRADLAFFRDALGLPELARGEGEEAVRSGAFSAGGAVIEVVTPEQNLLVDRMEANRYPSPRVRLSLEVEDAAATIAQLTRLGAELVSGARSMPWGTVSGRVVAPNGLQLSVTQGATL